MILSLLLATLFSCTPLVFAALGGYWSERSGVINIALEGLMLVGAFFAATVASQTHDPWIGLGAAMVSSAGLAAIYGFFVIVLRADQIVAGTAINFLAAGLVPFLGKVIFDSTGSTPGLSLEDRFHLAPVFLMGVSVVLVQWWRSQTVMGLWHQFAGEHPESLLAAGISVRKMRWLGVVMSGVFCGLGGACLSTFLSSSFSRDMTAGRGFMALAALILGKWRPIPAFFACVLFAFTDAIQARLQGFRFESGLMLPVQFVQILPYVITLLVLAGFVGQSRSPKALGRPI